MRRLGLLGLSSTAAAAVLAACGDDDDSAPVLTSTAPASAATSAAVGDEIRFPGPNGELIGVLATATPAAGAVLVIHENRGLTAHIRSLPARLAADGYTALAIDLLSAEGGTASMGDGDATGGVGERHDRATDR